MVSSHPNPGHWHRNQIQPGIYKHKEIIDAYIYYKKIRMGRGDLLDYIEMTRTDGIM